MKKNFYLKTTLSLILVLMLMPLGHALMILMEHYLEPTTLHYTAFMMGFVGMLVVIAGVFVRGDTKQTVFGLVGGLLFWTGWVEFLFAYYASRYGVHCDLVGTGVVETVSHYSNGVAVSHDFLVNGQPIESLSRAELKALRGSRPEYLIMPATFGMWMMWMMMYVFCTRTGCNFLMWIQRHLHIDSSVTLRPMAYHPAMVVFLELNIILWALYLLLMFCYDPVFLGDSHPVTMLIAGCCLVGAVFMARRQLQIPTWGRQIRMAVATVVVFWSFVEIVARNGVMKEFWVEPMSHLPEMSSILAAFVLSGVLIYRQHRMA